MTGVSFYRRRVLPRLIDLVMRHRANAAERAQLVPHARGDVLEIGIGSALNLPHYGAEVRSLTGVDPSVELWRIGRRRRPARGFPVRYVAASAEALPLAAASVDTVVSTWTLCSVPDLTAALAELRRVLRPGGRVVFIEHGRAPEPGVRAWQDRLTPAWRRIAGGCHLNRPIDALLEDAGFRPVALERGYGIGPRPMSYLYKGVAIAG